MIHSFIQCSALFNHHADAGNTMADENRHIRVFKWKIQWTLSISIDTNAREYSKKITEEENMAL